MKTTTLKTILGTAGKLLQNAPAVLGLLGTLPGGWAGLALTYGIPALGKVLSTVTADTITEAEMTAALASMHREEPFDLEALL